MRTPPDSQRAARSSARSSTEFVLTWALLRTAVRGLGCVKTRALRRPRLAFSIVRRSSRLAAELASRRSLVRRREKSQQVPSFLSFARATHISPFMLPCVEPRLIWRRIGIGSYRFLIRTRFLRSSRVTSALVRLSRCPRQTPLRNHTGCQRGSFARAKQRNCLRGSLRQRRRRRRD